MTPALYHGFLASAKRTPQAPALWVSGAPVSYAELRDDALGIAATLQRLLPAHAPSRTAVLADRSRVGFAGILGALLAGHGYVPLNVAFPAARSRRMLQQAGCWTLVVGGEAERQLDAILDGCDTPLFVLMPDRDDVSAFAARWRRHVFIGANDLASAAAWSECAPRAEDTAYLLFTSGSTGVPKGVGVTHANVTHFIDTVVERYGVTSSDRLSQMFDTTFDLSVFDLFAAWHVGACVFCPPRPTLLNPDRFIREHELTIWFSVPTIAMLMKRFGALQPDRYPSLRWSLFCGEALPMDLAQAWAAAAPASTLENLYGPTELTIACTAYRWDRQHSAAACHHGLVPIGSPLRGMRTRIVDERLNEVAPGHVGELLVTGPQRTNGYWRDDPATARSFVHVPGDRDVFYRTGDRVRRPQDDEPICYVGRMDHQIKVLGHRVELEEVESALRQEPGVHQAAAVGWPQTSTGTAGIVAFVAGQGIDVIELRARLGEKLQSYAVPQTIRVLPVLPQNASGKVDRQALLGLLVG